MLKKLLLAFGLLLGSISDLSAQAIAPAVCPSALSTCKYNHIATAGTTTVKTGAGTLHAIVFNTAGLGVTIYDSTTGSGTVIGVIGTSAVGTYTFDVGYYTGLTVVVTGTGDLTVSSN